MNDLILFCNATLAGAIPMLLYGGMSTGNFDSGETPPGVNRFRLMDGSVGWVIWTVLCLAYGWSLLGPALAHRFPGWKPWVLGTACGFLLLGFRATTRMEQRRRIAPDSVRDRVLWVSLLFKVFFAIAFANWAGPQAGALLFGALATLTMNESLGAFWHMEQQRRAANDAAWRTRLAPHFLFNTLNTLAAQIHKDPSGAQATTEQLGRLFRQLLSLSQKATVSLQEELTFVEDLLALHRARLGRRLRISIHIPEELETWELPTLSLQTLVENALKHGIEPLETGGEIRISAHTETIYGGFHTFSDLWITVENPYQIVSVPGTGTGLASLRARLRQPEDLVIAQTHGMFTASLRWRQPQPDLSASA